MATLLLVEDSPTEAQIITTCLESAGFSLLKVTTAEAAKAILEQKYADMVGLARPFLIESDLGKKFMDEETFSVSSPPLPQASGPFAWMLEGGFYSKYLINLATRKKPPFNLTAGGAIRHILFHVKMNSTWQYCDISPLKTKSCCLFVDTLARTCFF